MASLTQRKNAEATGVRRHVQARRLLQRNDTLVVESTSADRHVEPLDAQLRELLDKAFFQCLKGTAAFPNLHTHLHLPCQARCDVHLRVVSLSVPAVVNKTHRCKSEAATTS